MESFKLILRIKTYPELYDPSHENYSKLDKKQLAWEKLALDLNESGKDILMIFEF